MDWINWMYVVLGAGGYLIGFGVGNVMLKTKLESMVGKAFEEGVIIGLGLAATDVSGASPVEDYEMKVGE